MPNDILIVDDEADIRDLVAGILDDEGFSTRTARDSESALAEIANRRPHLIFLDIWLQGSTLDGLETLAVIKREHPGLPVVMISGHGNIETAVQSIKHGAYDFIEKPFKSDRLILIVERAMEAARLRRENEELRSRLGPENDLLGESSPVAHVRQQIDRVAPTGSRVLISGPPGCGKEVVARLLHQRSKRSTGPFIVINCAAMRADRLEVELFGSESMGDRADGPTKVG
ncbi:MAG: sigma-54-dependent transcriptional regulator, partial [Bradyrhizobium sp.]